VISYTIGRDDKVILSGANVKNSKGEQYVTHDDAEIQQKFPGKPTKHGFRTLAERAYVVVDGGFSVGILSARRQIAWAD
jgi:hypothetical protein